MLGERRRLPGVPVPAPLDRRPLRPAQAWQQHNTRSFCVQLWGGWRRQIIVSHTLVPPNLPHFSLLHTATTRVARNPNFGKLQAGYLFPEIARRRRAHQEARPDAKIISLGIGDTTEPIPPTIAAAMAKAAAGLGTLEGYSG